MSLLRFFLLSGLLIGCSGEPGVLVITKNASNAPLSVAVEYTGGEYRIENLEPGGRHQNRVNPTSESHVVLRIDTTNQRFTQTIDTYFERGYTGTLTIEIGPNGRVDWKDEIKP